MIERISMRKLIQSSTLELLNQNTIQDISVKQIAKNCVISPRTFYNYFKDKYEAANSIYIDYMRPFLKCDLKEWYFHLSSFIVEHNAFLKNTLVYAGQNAIQDAILELEWEKLLLHINADVLADEELLLSTKYAIEYMLFGNIGALLNYIVYKRHFFSPTVYSADNKDVINVWDSMIQLIPPIARENLSMEVQE